MLPPRTAAVVRTVRGFISNIKTEAVMGSMMAKVPQDVPVENASSSATRKKIAGIRFRTTWYFSTMAATKPPASR